MGICLGVTGNIVNSLDTTGWHSITLSMLYYVLGNWNDRVVWASCSCLSMGLLQPVMALEAHGVYEKEPQGCIKAIKRKVGQ